MSYLSIQYRILLSVHPRRFDISRKDMPLFWYIASNTSSSLHGPSAHRSRKPLYLSSVSMSYSCIHLPTVRRPTSNLSATAFCVPRSSYSWRSSSGLMSGIWILLRTVRSIAERGPREHQPLDALDVGPPGALTAIRRRVTRRRRRCPGSRLFCFLKKSAPGPPRLLVVTARLLAVHRRLFRLWVGARPRPTQHHAGSRRAVQQSAAT